MLLFFSSWSNYSESDLKLGLDVLLICRIQFKASVNHYRGVVSALMESVLTSIIRAQISAGDCTVDALIVPDSQTDHSNSHKRIIRNNMYR